MNIENKYVLLNSKLVYFSYQKNYFQLNMSNSILEKYFSSDSSIY